MNPTLFIRRFSATFLILALTLPPGPAFALRQVGLEESTKTKEDLARRLKTASTEARRNDSTWTRREFLRLGSVAGAGTVALPLAAGQTPQSIWDTFSHANRQKIIFSVKQDYTTGEVAFLLNEFLHYQQDLRRLFSTPTGIGAGRATQGVGTAQESRRELAKLQETYWNKFKKTVKDPALRRLLQKPFSLASFNEFLLLGLPSFMAHYGLLTYFQEFISGIPDGEIYFETFLPAFHEIEAIEEPDFGERLEGDLKKLGLTVTQRLMVGRQVGTGLKPIDVYPLWGGKNDHGVVMHNIAAIESEAQSHQELMRTTLSRYGIQEGQRVLVEVKFDLADRLRQIEQGTDALQLGTTLVCGRFFLGLNNKLALEGLSGEEALRRLKAFFKAVNDKHEGTHLLDLYDPKQKLDRTADYSGAPSLQELMQRMHDHLVHGEINAFLGEWQYADPSWVLADALIQTLLMKEGGGQAQIGHQDEHAVAIRWILDKAVELILDKERGGPERFGILIEADTAVSKIDQVKLQLFRLAEPSNEMEFRRLADDLRKVHETQYSKKFEMSAERLKPAMPLDARGIAAAAAGVTGTAVLLMSLILKRKNQLRKEESAVAQKAEASARSSKLTKGTKQRSKGPKGKNNRAGLEEKQDAAFALGVRWLDLHNPAQREIAYLLMSTLQRIPVDTLRGFPPIQVDTKRFPVFADAAHGPEANESLIRGLVMMWNGPYGDDEVNEEGHPSETEILEHVQHFLEFEDAESERLRNPELVRALREIATEQPAFLMRLTPEAPPGFGAIVGQTSLPSPLTIAEDGDGLRVNPEYEAALMASIREVVAGLQSPEKGRRDTSALNLQMWGRMQGLSARIHGALGTLPIDDPGLNERVEALRQSLRAMESYRQFGWDGSAAGLEEDSAALKKNFRFTDIVVPFLVSNRVGEGYTQFTIEAESILKYLEHLLALTTPRGKEKLNALLEITKPWPIKDREKALRRVIRGLRSRTFRADRAIRAAIQGSREAGKKIELISVKLTAADVSKDVKFLDARLEEFIREKKGAEGLYFSFVEHLLVRIEGHLEVLRHVLKDRGHVWVNLATAPSPWVDQLKSKLEVSTRVRIQAFPEEKRTQRAFRQALTLLRREMRKRKLAGLSGVSDIEGIGAHPATGLEEGLSPGQVKEKFHRWLRVQDQNARAGVFVVNFLGHSKETLISRADVRKLQAAIDSLLDSLLEDSRLRWEDQHPEVPDRARLTFIGTISRSQQTLQFFKLIGDLSRDESATGLEEDPLRVLTELYGTPAAHHPERYIQANYSSTDPRLAEELFRALQSEGVMGPGTSFVDLGSGVGLVVHMAHVVAGVEATGVEKEEALVQIARGLTEQLAALGVVNPEKIHWEKGDLEKVDLERFDVVFVNPPLKQGDWAYTPSSFIYRIRHGALLIMPLGVHDFDRDMKPLKLPGVEQVELPRPFVGYRIPLEERELKNRAVEEQIAAIEAQPQTATLQTFQELVRAWEALTLFRWENPTNYDVGLSLEVLGYARAAFLREKLLREDSLILPDVRQAAAADPEIQKAMRVLESAEPVGAGEIRGGILLTESIDLLGTKDPKTEKPITIGPGAVLYYHSIRSDVEPKQFTGMLASFSWVRPNEEGKGMPLTVNVLLEDVRAHGLRIIPAAGLEEKRVYGLREVTDYILETKPEVISLLGIETEIIGKSELNRLINVHEGYRDGYEAVHDRLSRWAGPPDRWIGTWDVFVLIQRDGNVLRLRLTGPNLEDALSVEQVRQEVRHWAKVQQGPTAAVLKRFPGNIRTFITEPTPEEFLAEMEGLLDRLPAGTLLYWYDQDPGDILYEASGLKGWARLTLAFLPAPLLTERDTRFKNLVDGDSTGLEEWVMAREMAVAAWGQVPSSVWDPGRAWNWLLVIENPELASEGVLAVKRGFAVAFNFDGPSAVGLEELLGQLPVPTGHYAVGVSRAAWLLQEYPRDSQVLVTSPEQIFNLVGLEEWAAVTVAQAIESTRNYLKMAATAA